ncbi:MAG TPA: Mpo1-like protein, partial [Pseudodesulfovibrio sp.]|nr:Mpo1-like protein [Pseudodesulfovibrio sp.]
LVALLASIPRPAGLALSPLIHWGTVLLVIALAYYTWLAPRLIPGMLVVSALLVLATWGLQQLPWSLAITSGGIFVAAWVGQFIGHYFEGKRPAFLKDLQFLLIGPLWLLAWVYRRLGLRIA